MRWFTFILIWAAAVAYIALLVLLAAKQAPNLECSVDGTLTFVAYDVAHWDIAQGTLDVVSEEGGELFVMSRVMLAGETCREVYSDDAGNVGAEG